MIITKINENYEKVYYQEYLNFLGHINKKFVENYDIIIVSENFYNLFCLFINKDNILLIVLLLTNVIVLKVQI